ncbi:hypothetical protein [Micromonospora globbae]|uniref:hypothetical protein n=1 Tax=Micromonospora globbae TaxID=1894969 RepID=UPI003422055B
MTAPTRVRSPKTDTTSWVQRRERAAAMPLPPTLGRLAGTTLPHTFDPIAETLGLPQCRHCFGWSDDVRHPAAGGPVVGR